MNSKRRSFLKISSLLAGTAIINNPIAAAANITRKINAYDNRGLRVCIFHTNDLFGKIDACFKNHGGLTNVGNLLDAQEDIGLLLDAGNFMDLNTKFSDQLNMISIMNNKGYHVATTGHHELSEGEEKLAKLVSYMQFDLVNCNYSFQNSYLKKAIKPFVIINSGKFKIGITGAGHRIENIGFKDPIISVNQIATHLKTVQKCDLVICLSQLGHLRTNDTADNRKLAEHSDHIDMIISGDHLNSTSVNHILKNKTGHDVVLSQSAKNGLMFGKTEFLFNSAGQKQKLHIEHLIPGTTRGASYTNAFDEIAKLKLA